MNYVTSVFMCPYCGYGQLTTMKLTSPDMAAYEECESPELNCDDVEFRRTPVALPGEVVTCGQCVTDFVAYGILRIGGESYAVSEDKAEPKEKTK